MRELLERVPRTARRALVDAGQALDASPGAGKVLRGELEGYRSIHAVRDRYRLVFRVDLEEGRIIVVYVGRRRPGSSTDVYEVARKLLRARLLGDV